MFMVSLCHNPCSTKDASPQKETLMCIHGKAHICLLLSVKGHVASPFDLPYRENHCSWDGVVYIVTIMLLSVKELKSN